MVCTLCSRVSKPTNMLSVGLEVLDVLQHHSPVGAHTNMFSLLYSAQSLTRLCTRLRLVMPPNAGWAQSGRSVHRKR